MFNERKINWENEVTIATGALGAIFSVINNFAGEGDEVLVFEPYFSLYINQIDFSGAKVMTAPMYTNENGVWFMDFKAFEAAINEKTKLIVITNPHNPTGKMWTEEEIKKLTEIMNRHPHVTILSDEVYFHLSFDGRKHLSFANYGNNWEKTLTVFSAGKLLNITGWKIGWTIGPANLIKHALFVHESTAFNANAPG